MKKNSTFTPYALVILDGFGHNDKPKGNAIHQAKMPFYTSCLKHHPHTLLHASGTHVGLPKGYIGNSQVGHKTMGAGKIVLSSLAKINQALDDGSFAHNQQLNNLMNRIQQNKTDLHLVGLLSDGGVHSHEKHLYALIAEAATKGIANTYVHAFLDGRDVSQQSALKYLGRLETVLEKYPHAHLASIHGRYYAMDRDNNKQRTQRCYDVLTQEDQEKPKDGYAYLIEHSYSLDITDEFIPPTLLDQNGIIKEGDGIIFFNFRPDRQQQLAGMFVDRGDYAGIATMTGYDPAFTKAGITPLLGKEQVESTLLDTISQKYADSDKAIYAIAETEKYAHITYFFRGERKNGLPNEHQELIPSLKEKKYVEHPEMSAQEITDTVVHSLQTDPYHFYLINYANADMVGHSGDLHATIKACEVLDVQLKTLYEEFVIQRGGVLFITADHGKAEEMIESATGAPKTAHTLNPVPFMILSKDPVDVEMPEPYTQGLAAVAPIILKVMFG